MIHHLLFNLPPGIYHPRPVYDLDAIPFPDRNALREKGGNIFANNRNYFEGGSTVFLTSRGCPFKCTFCASPMISSKFRYRSPEDIRAEITGIVEQLGIRQIRISDDMFAVNTERVKEVCNVFKRHELAWRISTRVKPFTEEIANTLVESGCREVSFGVESFDNNVLKVLRKGTTAEDNEQAIRIAHNAGLTVRILFMIRTPGQTNETVDINIKYLEKLDSYYDVIACTSFVPLPGSDIWYHPENYGIEIVSRDLADYNFYFYSGGEPTMLKDIIRIPGRDVNAESERFRKYILQIGKVNKG
jgi:radical SAM superfamily enzyme YgiQ (UPF0313 family)